MRLFIAEKPELARAISNGIEGNAEQNNSHIIKGNSIITWAYGHIMQLAEPHFYNEAFKKWNINDLPLKIPYPFKRIPNHSSENQFKTIIKLINDSRITEIVHCGDADEEGQILIDEILEYSKTNKPITRCLINDITPKAIATAISKIEPNSNFKGLSESGFARSEADYIVGMNLTRFYTILNQRNSGSSDTITIGRVQTPILGLIVNRELENKNFKSLNYFSINGNFNINGNNIQAPLKLEKDERIVEEEIANNIKNNCINKNAKLKLEVNKKMEYPPLPYNLLELQAECAKIFGFSPDKVLSITQSLREKHKAISYNRSDCQYLPENLFEESPQVIETLKYNFKDEDIGQNNADIRIKSKAFDDSKLSAHYGIVPLQTKLELNNLSKDELQIYTLIAKRFLMQFYKPCEYQTYKFSFLIDEYLFETSIRKDLFLGFKKYFSKQEQSSAVDWLDSVKNIEVALCENISISKEKTKPRPKYTMTTLLKDLNQVSKYVKDERIKKLLVEKDKDKKGESGGIGTPATRSNHIKTLIDREYIQVSKDKKQNITATQKGIKLIQALSPMLTQPDMTALWFEKQKEIMNGTLSRKEFLNSVEEFIKEIIEQDKEKTMSVSQNKEQNQNITSYECPLCKKGSLIRRESKNKKGSFWYGCSEYNNGCKFICNEINGKPNLNNEVQGQTDVKCPQCQKGFLIKKESVSKKTNKPYTWYGCSDWKNGCKFSCFEKDGKPNLDGD
ncbi:DNA topoisomerase (plasmid) [Helicobacter cinaedi]|uniref:DNA topoisomerase 3 n=1 Tax=Helicobacter cinaedi TaxID=213 RepID=UPI001EED031B|nr:DNA topoisomerase 3 [Helicobacter cinaedi]BDB65747.1 DNA topoisomerase [Helicobacter cinaedi]